jgi:predicted glycoside hydrolase/deacetylase ChbG (UPF0249 family)
MNNSQANRLLGYPADARLLIINADDFGMCNSINEAIIRALKEGVVRSTTLMVPCPWALHAMHFLADHPDIPFGIHLTVISDWVDYRWGPITPREKVPSLLDESGYFNNFDHMQEFLSHVKLDELEMEFRAQIETVLAAGLKPTHLDWHCLHSGGRADIFDLTLGLAQEYGLAVRVAQRPLSASVQLSGLPTVDFDLMDSFRIDTATKPARYAQMLHDLPEGLSEWAVHPSIGTAKSQAIDAGWPVRRADFDFLMSADAKEIIRREGITVLSYAPLQTLWRELRS